MTKTQDATAVVLGGTSAHAVLIENLRARGYRIVLIDYLPDPPAAKLADVHVQSSTLSVADVKRIAQEEGAALVIATSVDQANVIACKVSEDLNLPHPYSSATGHAIANKGIVKRRMLDLDLLTSRFICLTDPATLDAKLVDAGLRFPLIVKPVDSNGSKGVLRCDSPADLEAGLLKALEYSRSGEAIVEEFIEGDEFNIYALIADGKPHLVTACRKYNHESTDGTAITSFATWYQNRLPEWFAEKLEVILNRITTGFELHNTAMLLQVLVRDQEVHVLEFAPRVGGGLSYWAVALQARYDLVDSMVEAWLGNTPALPAPITSSIVITSHLYAKPCTFDHIEGVDTLLHEGTIESYIPNKTKNGKISSEKASRDRVGSFVLQGESTDDILGRVARVMEVVEAYDVEGRPVTDKETYLRSV